MPPTYGIAFFFHPLFTTATTTTTTSFFFFLLLLISPSPSTGEATSFTLNNPIPDNTGTNQLLELSGSYIVQGAIQVTPDVSKASISNLSGRALYMNPVHLWNRRTKTMASFNSTFILNISPVKGVGGEGLAFILTASSPVPANSHGQWLGIVNSTTTTNNNNNNSTSIVAIEFDTKKSYPQDIDSNHLGLDVGTILSRVQIPMSDFGINISSGSDINATIRYLAPSKTIEAYIYMVGDTPSTTPVLTYPIDLSQFLPHHVFVGFSASTGDDTELNCVKSWHFSISDVGSDEASLLWLWVGVPVGSVVVLGGGGLFLLLLYLRRRRRRKGEEGGEDIEWKIQNSARAPKRYKLKELKASTGNFSAGNALGRGGFGTVYRGVIEGGKVVAVKRVARQTAHGRQDFVAEVTTIGNLNHKNLVKLLGWCNEGGELLLVYEFMEKGSLEGYIYRERGADGDGDGEELLKWEGRRRVIRGVAGALDYLHNGSDKRVVHRDVKASNILLDGEYGARLGDFGLARTVEEKAAYHSTKEIAGTPGYMAPESFQVGRATAEGDVYAFGVMVMEVVCGRRPGRQAEENGYSNGIVEWVWGCYQGGRLISAADGRLLVQGGEMVVEMERVMVLGLACCHPNPYERPSMRTVVQVLDGVETPPHVPLHKPIFMWPPPPSSSSSSSSSTSYQSSAAHPHFAPPLDASSLLISGR